MEILSVEEQEDGSALVQCDFTADEIQKLIETALIIGLTEGLIKMKEEKLNDLKSKTNVEQIYTDCEKTWMAGLLEGEGCFSIFARKTAKHDHKTLAIHCEMTDKDTIEKLHNIAGVGTVNKRANVSGRQDRRERKPTWIWSVQNHEGIYKVCKAIYPYMGQRRKEKIKELMEYVESKTNLGDA